MTWKIAVVITDYVSGAPVLGVLVTSDLGAETTSASGAASLPLGIEPDRVGISITVPSPPAETGNFTTWNMALVLTDYDGIPLSGMVVDLDGWPDVRTDQSGKATVRFKIFASAGQALSILANVSSESTGPHGLSFIVPKGGRVTVGASGLTPGTSIRILD